MRRIKGDIVNVAGKFWNKGQDKRQKETTINNAHDKGYVFHGKKKKTRIQTKELRILRQNIFRSSDDCIKAKAYNVITLYWSLVSYKSLSFYEHRAFLYPGASAEKQISKNARISRKTTRNKLFIEKKIIIIIETRSSLSPVARFSLSRLYTRERT